MRTRRTALIFLAVPILLLVAVAVAAMGPSSGGLVVPQGGLACDLPLDPVDDGSGIMADLVISEISPGSHIELFNTTDQPIDLDTSIHQLCSPFDYAAVTGLVSPGTIVPVGGFVVVGWPASFTDLDSGGEVIVYSDNDFSDSTHILDFVCWGTNPHSSRLGQAESVGKWSGGCASVLAASAIHRLRSTDGTTIASYDVVSVPSPMTCTLGLVFDDGFESGDTSGWSSTVP